MRIMIAGATSAGLLLGSYARELRALGHEVMSVSVPFAATQSGSPWLRWRRVPIISRVGAPQLMIEANRVITIQAIRWQPDVILTDGEGVTAGALATVQASTGCRSVMIYPDPLVNLREEITRALPVYDLVIYACGTFGQPYFEHLGARRTAYLPFGWDEQVHPRPSAAELGPPVVDVGFVGAWQTDREAWLDALDGFDVGVWGPKYWRTKAARDSVGRRRWRGPVWGSAYARASRQARITLNLVDTTNGPGLNMRAFEAAGVGCFVLSTRTEAQQEFFREGEEIAYFASTDELRDKVRYYLRHPEQRERIAANAARLAESHTYRQRAAQLLQLLDTVPTPGEVHVATAPDRPRHQVATRPEITA